MKNIFLVISITNCMGKISQINHIYLIISLLSNILTALCSWQNIFDTANPSEIPIPLSVPSLFKEVKRYVTHGMYLKYSKGSKIRPKGSKNNENKGSWITNQNTESRLRLWLCYLNFLYNRISSNPKRYRLTSIGAQSIKSYFIGTI